MPSYTDFAAAEYRSASLDLAAASPQESVIRFYQRQDQAIKAAAAGAPVQAACRPGCSYCCHYKVEAQAAEVLAIRQFVLERFKPDMIKATLARARQNVEEVKGLTYAQHLTVNQRCPFLIDDQCAVYPVRPSKCRAYHASDASDCQRAYDNPADLSIKHSYINGIRDAAAGTAEGFDAALKAAGTDARAYDLNSAFLEAMQSPNAAKLLKAGKKVFRTAKTEG